MTENCYHCGEPVLTGDSYQVEIFNDIKTMCCPGCQAVAATIVASGLTSYYQYRTATADKSDLVPEELQSFSLYDNDDVQKDFVSQRDNVNDVILSIDGISCAACAWLIEKKLSGQKGVIRIQVNSTNQRASVSWDPNQTKLSKILSSIHRLGYQAAPFEADNQEIIYHRQTKQYLYRLGVAGLATMQVMMLAFALYFEIFSDMDEAFRNYLRWVSLIFATPVLLYSALPFYINAWRSVKARTLGMDVPVSIALLFAYSASLYATVQEKGEVFFESVAMFTFFLLLGRFLELRARRTAVAASANLLKLIPKLATLIDGSQLPAKSLQPGDKVRILPGEAVPADGVIISGITQIDESMLTGESIPKNRSVGDSVFAGTVNIEGNLDIEVSKRRQDSLISEIVRLQDEAQMTKPRIAELADVIARYFIVTILLVSLCTWLYWTQQQPDDAFWIMLSVLVATCPCALSLATPAALTCATSSLGKLGILLRRGHALETLPKVNRLIIDKTGTLTEGNIELQCHEIYIDKPPAELLSIASALESFSSHPIAAAFAEVTPNPNVSDVSNDIGCGLTGRYQNQTWKIGKPDYALSDTSLSEVSKHQVWLSCEGNAIASFHLSDPIRDSSFALIQSFKEQNIETTILTGDSSQHAMHVAEELGIDNVVSGVTPKGKLEYLNELAPHDVALMVGDGVNDAPVLAGAHLSVAMGGGSDIAKASADMILLGDDLQRILDARARAIKVRRIIRQNLAWALGYNIIILPLAVLGFVAPYVAVAGMSASSLIVVANSLRLLKDPYEK
ncbi:heavy metal translocating P-type ATPase [Veronia pacifica]|uniref:P-type Cu(2+) transporter n=1 Tax=Veronia pacifica TaxID=1080227 RepID=A0A1C3EEV2_9GAMM|nr:heavy metal translocating P-type ATPase [Veronia pacifica]ODA31750.1 ATPase P [Veronia pacifica]